MREILFRGKDVKENWHIGLLSHIRNAWYISNLVGSPLAYEVIPSTIGEYTGLTDKNDKKIFEGDILYAKNEFHDYYERFIVVWDDEAAGFYFNGCRNTDCNYFFDNLSDIKIIGNIHDNPELLEEI